MNSKSFDEIINQIYKMEVGHVNIMEVCGTHTMSIAKAGLRDALPDNIKLLSGPGCPVCVTPDTVIDAILSLAAREDIIIATYGDMIRVPGSVHGENLAASRARGSRVKIVYSPIDAIKIAKENPTFEVVFLGVGFETTAPGTAAAIAVAESEGVLNFSVLSMLKMVEPALRALIADEAFDVQGFLCPGHVATVIGSRGFNFLADEYKIPCAVGGFEPLEIITAIYEILCQIQSGKARLKNSYPRAVREGGNPLAIKMTEKYFIPQTSMWRGLGEIANSGLSIRKEFRKFDAEYKLNIRYNAKKGDSPCRCGDVICAKIAPCDCPLFGKTCMPENPVGPCMVSSEGACAAAYKYGSWGSLNG